MASEESHDVVFRHVNRRELERRSRPESSHKGNLKRLKTSSVGGFQRWEKENELLWAMLEDETEWLAKLFPDIIITPELFFFALEDGVVLCRLANLVQESAEEYGRKNKVNVPSKRFKFHASIPKKNKQLALFKSRENVQGFLTWCRQIGISDSILFESNDVVEADECREGCREVVICLMEIARRASGSFKFTPIPKLIQLEKEIEAEEQKEAEENSSDQVDYASSDEESNNLCPSPEAHSPPTHDGGGGHTLPEGSKKKSKRHQPKSELDKEVLKIIDNFNFYNIRKIKEGKYMILGKIIFVRMLNGHVLLRIGGGWDTLEHYLLTHLPKAAPENGHCSTDAAVSPSVSKTPQKSQLTKILDRAKKEQQLKATPASTHRPAGFKGNKADEGSGDDEKDITSAIRKIEFSVNQNIATRRKVSRNEETPQKSANSVEENSPPSLGTPSDINQNNIHERRKHSKSRSPEKRKSRNMDNELVGSEFSEHNGDVALNSEHQNGDELLSFEGALVKENANVDESVPSEEQCETPESIDTDVVDGAVLAKLNTESTPEPISTEQEEAKLVDFEPNIDTAKDSSCDNEQSSVPDFEVSVEPSEETSAEQAPAEAITENPDDVPNEPEPPTEPPTDVWTNDAEIPLSVPEVPSSDSEVPTKDPEVLPSNPDVLPTDAEVSPDVSPDVPPVIPEDVKNSESLSPDPDSTSPVATTPDVPQSPQKSPSPTGKKGGTETPKKKAAKSTKESAKSKPPATKAPAKKEPASSADARPKSARPSSRPTTAGTNTKRPATGVKSSTAAKPSTAAAKTTTTTKPSALASKTKAPPSGRPTATKTTGKTSPTGKTSATPSTLPKRPTSKPDPKAAPSTRTTKPDPKATPSTRPARPAKTSAFGSTVSTTASKKPAQNSRPATAPPARGTTTQAKKTRPVAAKVQSWSRPQSAKPSTKEAAKDSTDGGASSKETGADRPTSPTKPLIRKTQTRTVTTLKTTRVGAGGEPEVKSQTLKTTRTVTEANGKKTTKTTVKEIAPTGRKPLRMTTEKTEGRTVYKKTTKVAADPKTAAKTAKPGTKKPETKPGAKTGSSRPSKETGAKKVPAKSAPKNKEVSGQIKEVPKAKTVKELSNALGITKPEDEKEKGGKEIENEAVDKETVKQEVESSSQEETPELAPAQIEEEKEVEKEPTDVKEIANKELEAPSREETPELSPVQIEESPQVEESAQAEESVKVEEFVQVQESSPEPDSEDIVQSQGTEEIENQQDGESGPIVNVEGGIEEVPQGREGICDDSDKTVGEVIDHELNVDVELSEDIVSDVNLVVGADHVHLEETPVAEQRQEQVTDEAEQVDVDEKKDEAEDEITENGDEVGDEITGNDEINGESVLQNGDTITTTDQVMAEAHGEIIVPDTPELPDQPEMVEQPDLVYDKSVDESLEDDSLDVIEVPESDVSYEENALQSTEAWPAVNVDKEHTQDIDLLGDNNNAIEEPQETEPKFDPYLLPSGAEPEEPADTIADQNLFDISAGSWLSGNLGNTGEPPNRDSGFQESNTVDDLLG